MRRVWFAIVAITLFAISFLSYSFWPSPESTVKEKENCPGYTVIEAGKGINCYGDTIKLVKRHGFYELASRYEDDIASASN